MPWVQWHGVRASPSDLPESRHHLSIPDGPSVLRQELGHLLGLPHLHLLRVAAEDKMVTGEVFLNGYNPWQGYIMYYMPTGAFMPWGEEIVDQENESFPFRYHTWHDYHPDNTVLQVVDKSGMPLPLAELRVYSHEQNPELDKQEIDNIPE